MSCINVLIWACHIYSKINFKSVVIIICPLRIFLNALNVFKHICVVYIPRSNGWDLDAVLGLREKESTNHSSGFQPYVISNGPITCPPLEENASKEGNCSIILGEIKDRNVAAVEQPGRSLSKLQSLLKFRYSRIGSCRKGMSDSYRASRPAG